VSATKARGRRRGTAQKSGSKKATTSTDKKATAPARRSRATTPWSDGDHQLFATLVAQSTMKIELARDTMARRAVEADRLCRVLDSITDKKPEEVRAHNAASKIYRHCLATLDLLDTTNKDEPGKL